MKSTRLREVLKYYKSMVMFGSFEKQIIYKLDKDKYLFWCKHLVKLKET